MKVETKIIHGVEVQVKVYEPNDTNVDRETKKLFRKWDKYCDFCTSVYVAKRIKGKY